MISKIFNEILNLVYPHNCQICHAKIPANISPKGFVCLNCENTIIKNIPPFCPKCSRFIGNRPKSYKCSSCTNTPPLFDFAWSSCLYQDQMIDLLHRFKYHKKTYLKHVFSKLMINFIHTHNLDIHQFDLIVPIPCSKTRLRERGYNQSELLAQHISRHFHIPLNSKILIKTHPTRHQVELSQKERWTNIQGAFKIKPSLEEIINKSILIVDDLLTTGATTSEAAKTLKASGAKTVGVFTLAIAPKLTTYENYS